MTDQPVGLVVHSLPSPQGALGAAQRRGRLQLMLVLLVCALPVILSYALYFGWRPSQLTAYGELIQPSRALPARVAHDLDGQPVPLRSLVGQWLLVSVGPSACDTACEQRLFMQRQLREMTGRDRERIDKLWLITDDGPVSPGLRAALAQTPGMHLLRLPLADVQAWLEPGAGRGLHEHLYLVDPMGEWMMREPVQPDPAKIKRDLERLLRASASWDRPGRSSTAVQGRP